MAMFTFIKAKIEGDTRNPVIRELLLFLASGTEKGSSENAPILEL